MNGRLFLLIECNLKGSSPRCNFLDCQAPLLGFRQPHFRVQPYKGRFGGAGFGIGVLSWLSDPA
jgi:hypothetical protein